MEITIKIDQKNKQAKAFLEYIQTLEFVRVTKKSPYDPEFVKMIKKSAQSKNRTKVDPKNVWENL